MRDKNLRNITKIAAKYILVVAVKWHHANVQYYEKYSVSDELLLEWKVA